MKNILYLVIGLFLVSLSSAVLNFREPLIFNYKANIIIIYIVYLSIFIGSERSSIIGLILGLVLDVSVGRFFGLNGLLFFLLGLLYGTFKDKIFKDRVFAPIILLILAVMIDSFVMTLISNVNFNSLNLYQNGMRIIEIMVMNIFLGIIAYYPIKYIVNKIES
ncbi:rod shape-determining protein MreD [Acetoanaerobium pronyense]|uniref:Rod shape-determining protein MreD n=1 Tax=Acetoanaerobium pronyense TaxID=1482736 RepID=A0ABS4KJZ6_9FIRM|nr:rod shape-determining protein MreD [Acetoanaerobium pronyense]MBP2028105.1 rod shape-determining protein MreD [Acetoanaerobium pronyense]